MLQNKYFSAEELASQSTMWILIWLSIFVTITTSARKFASASMLEKGKIRVRVREMVKGFGLWQTKLLGQKNEQ